MTRSRHQLTAWVAFCAIFFAEFQEPNYAEDGLQQLQSEARGSGPFDEPSHWSDQKQQRSSHEDCEDDDDCLDSELTNAIVFGAVLVASSPFWAPAKLIGDEYSCPGFFPRYPYQQPVDGYLMIDPFVPRKPREWAGRAFFEYGGDFDDLTTWNGGLLLETTARFGIDSTARYYTQQLPAGSHDTLWTGDANLVFRFAQSPQLEMHTGIGFNWLDDSIGSDFGFNFTYRGDWFPVSPFIVSSELDWGEIGHASLFHGRITGGVQWHRGEFYAGFDYLDVGNAQLETWVSGVRFWF